MVFLPAPPGLEPVWNSDTDEIVVTVNGVALNGAGVIDVPQQCTYMIFTISDTGSGSGTIVAVSPDSTDLNSGYYIENELGGLRNFGTAVAPGTRLYLHTPGGEQIDVNILRFYTKK